MSTLALVAIAGAGAIAVLVGGHAGTRGRIGTMAGLAALLVLLVGGLALPAGAPGSLSVPDAAGPFERLVGGGDYVRLVIVMWSTSALLLAALGTLVGGGRGLLAASLGGIAGGIVALGSADLVFGACAAVTGGLAGMAAVGTAHGESGEPRATAAAGREMRMVVATGGIVVAASAAISASAGVLFSGGEPGSADPGRDAAASAVVGLAAVGIAGALAIRLGSVPFHLRVARLADVVPASALPLLLAWGVVPFAAVALAIADRQVAPLALELDGERAVMIGLALLTLAGGALAAWIRDDLRHLVAYLVVAEAGLLLAGFAALGPEAWAPARVWLLVLATSKTALAAWLAALESRFQSRDIADIRGWVRHAPVLAFGFALVVLATFALPGWAGWVARMSLASGAAGGALEMVLVVAGFLTLPVYLRVLTVGLGRPLSRVASAPPERLLPIAPPSLAGVSPAEAIRRLAASMLENAQRNRPLLGSLIVVALALLAVLVAWGVADVAGAAAQPLGEPAVPGPG